MDATMQSTFCCPVCHAPLAREGGSLKCEQGHCFDLARKGYVNLLRSNQSARKRHGDDRAMVLARRAFLDSGAYAPLRSRICALLEPCLRAGERVLDVGCGECYYTAALAQSLAAAGKPCRVCGVDISRDALAAGAARERSLELAVASAAHLPAADGSMDALLSVFAPLPAEEAVRVLRADGYLLRVVPREGHLMGLKRAVYDIPYPNDPPDPALPGFRLIGQEALDLSLTLTDAQQIQNLFCMTPYYYKTGRADQQKLLALTRLETGAEFALFLYQRGEKDK